MKPLTKKLLTGYLASTMFLSGCATTSYSSRSYKIGNIPASRIQLVDRTPQSLDDLMNASGEFEKALPYMQKFYNIKSNIRIGNESETRRNIRDLVSDVERSDLKSKYNLSKQFKDFGYYKFEETTAKRTTKGDGTFTALAILGGLVWLGSEYGSSDDESGEEDSSVDAGGLLAYCGVLFVGYLISQITQEKRHTTYNKVYYNPYEGSSRTVQTNLRK